MIAENLKRLRANRGVGRKELAEALSLPYTTYTNYETGSREPNAKVLKALAFYYGVSVDEIIGYEKLTTESQFLGTFPNPVVNPIHKNEPSESSHIRKYRSLDDYGRETVDLVLDRECGRCKKAAIIPIRPEEPELENVDVNVYDIPAAAGRGNYLDQSGYETMSFPRTKVPRNTSFGVRIDGNSMEPKIMDGSIAFVQECQKIEDGEIGIFYLNGESLCKQLMVDHKLRKIRLHSINPKHKDKIVDDDQDLRTFGRVVGAFDEMVKVWQASKDGDPSGWIDLPKKTVDEFVRIAEQHKDFDFDPDDIYN